MPLIEILRDDDTDVLEMPVTDVTDTTDIGLPAKCVLFDDDYHTFDEVIGQIIKATKCSFPKAERYTNEVHTKGKSIVFEGDLSRCMNVSSVLEEIALRTQVEL
ncbi:MAG: ATP-dependent Clp protease adaptor ClpS [Candidatus Kapabacteria bacterium]|nr:ATP-dependent Clp protease adaptor ClpS [Candidatus Kapabacteria bacterium]